MNVLLSFSEHHFHPITLTNPQTSSGLIAKQIYDFFVRSYGQGSIYYIDPEKFDSRKFKGINFHKFVGLDVHFISIAKRVKANENILIAVNQHPIFRRKIITKLFKTEHNLKALHSSDGIYSISKQANFADKILVIGNELTIDTYRKIYGHHKILVSSSYSVPKIHVKSKKDLDRVTAYVGNLNFRKCADIYLHIIKSNVFTEDFKLVLVGTAVNSYWSKKFEMLSGKTNFEWHHSMNPNSEELLDLLNRTKFAMFLTREEGLSGSYLLISNAKIPVLTSKYVGIDPMEEFNFDVDADFSISLRKLEELIKSSKSDFAILRDKANDLFENRLFNMNSIEQALSTIIKINLKKSRWKYLFFYNQIIRNSYMDFFNIFYLRYLFVAHYIYQKQRMFFLISYLRNF